VNNYALRTTPRPFVSVEEAALLLGEARSTLYRALKSGSFPVPVIRIGARLRIPRIAIDRLIAGEDLPLSIRIPNPSGP
jgi:excisionase family DNA binding protein